MPYILQTMTQDDIPQVAAVERLCFSMPWPTSAYRRELKTPETNRYIVARYLPPSEAARLGLQPPTEATLTRFEHPELAMVEHRENGDEPRSQQGGRSLWATLLPWLHKSGNGTGNGASATPWPVVGYAGLWLMLDEAHVTTIGVHPDHRGRGAGELLFLGLADIAREMRAGRITLEVRVSNTGAQTLYRKYGLEVTGLRRRYYSDNGEDAYIMWSDPIDSPQHITRIHRLRTELAHRLAASHTQDLAPSRPVDASKLQ
jgi:[ribosomal protein S18]-alanine N-acetyltransferase